MRLSLVRISVLPGVLGGQASMHDPELQPSQNPAVHTLWMVLRIIAAFGPVETCTAAPGSFDRPVSQDGTGGFAGGFAGGFDG